MPPGIVMVKIVQPIFSMVKIVFDDFDDQRVHGLTEQL